MTLDIETALDDYKRLRRWSLWPEAEALRRRTLLDCSHEPQYPSTTVTGQQFGILHSDRDRASIAFDVAALLIPDPNHDII